MPRAHAIAIQRTKSPSAATKINDKINYCRRARITIITKTPDDMEDQFNGTRGDELSSQHSQRNKREYGCNNRHSSRPPSDGESPSRSECYDRDKVRESNWSGKTPYNNGGKEDACNARGAEDKESDGQASQCQGDYDNDAFEPEVGHNTRGARAQAQQSPDHATQEHNE
jgi:hypothetical protein